MMTSLRSATGRSAVRFRDTTDSLTTITTSNTLLYTVPSDCRYAVVRIRWAPAADGQQVLMRVMTGGNATQNGRSESSAAGNSWDNVPRGGTYTQTLAPGTAVWLKVLTLGGWNNTGLASVEAEEYL